MGWERHYKQGWPMRKHLWEQRIWAFACSAGRGQNRAMYSSDTLSALSQLVPALAGRHTAEDAFKSIETALARTVGHRLFTVLIIDEARMLDRRIYSSDPLNYPCGGTKPLYVDNDFYRTVVTAGLSRYCRDKEECRRAFFDYDVIEALGCESAVNVPVRWNGVTLGSLNLLHKAGWYHDGMADDLALFATMAVPLYKQELLAMQNSPAEFGSSLTGQ